MASRAANGQQGMAKHLFGVGSGAEPLNAGEPMHLPGFGASSKATTPSPGPSDGGFQPVNRPIPQDGVGWKRLVRSCDVVLRLSIRILCVGLDSEIEAMVGGALESAGSAGCAETCTLEQALSNPCKNRVVLMEIWEANSGGVENVQRIKKLSTPLPVIVCTAREDKTGVLLGLGAGANGYLIRPFSREQILHAVGDVLSGGSFLCPRAQYLLASAVDQWEAASRHRLSPREDEIMSCVLAGHSNKRIGAELSISPATVHAHMVRIFSKLDVRSREEAVRRYWNFQA